MDDAISKAEALKARGRGLMRQAALVGGQWVAEGEPIAVDDPSDGSILGHVPALPRARVDDAIKAAADAFPGWAATTEFGRGGLLRLWADLIDDNRDGLAALLALENGKPYAEAQGEIDYANSFVKWFAAEADRLNGDVIPSPVRGHRIVTFKEAVGPVAAITPWNFPAAMITRKVAPGPRRRLHRGAEARVPDPVHGAGPGRAGARGRPAAGRVQRGHRQERRGRPRADRLAPDPQAQLHRLHPGGPPARRAVRADPEAPVDGARRRRAPDRLRGRRPRPGDRRDHRGQVPLLGPDLRLPQPRLRP